MTTDCLLLLLGGGVHCHHIHSAQFYPLLCRPTFYRSSSQGRLMTQQHFQPWTFPPKRQKKKTEQQIKWSLPSFHSKTNNVCGCRGSLSVCMCAWVGVRLRLKKGMGADTQEGTRTRLRGQINNGLLTATLLPVICMQRSAEKVNVQKDTNSTIISRPENCLNYRLSH